MEQPIKDRRYMSQSGLLDTAIRTMTTLAATSDPVNRSLAGQGLASLVQLRRAMPARRQHDRKIR